MSTIIRHVVLVRFRDDATIEQRDVFIARAQWSRDAEYVMNYACGFGVGINPAATSGTDEWHWGMTLDLAEADVDRYRNDPRHTSIGPEVTACTERYAILDFAID